MMRLFILPLATVWTGRVNATSFSYPLYEVAYDAGAATGVLLKGQTVLFGTSAGQDDLGRQRLRDIPVGASGTLKFGSSSQGIRDGEVNLQDNAHITILNHLAVWSKIPFIDPDGVIFKDGDIAFAGQTGDDSPPVANAGPWMAGTIDPGTGKLRVQLPASGANNSWATADGATITAYGWVLPSAVTLVGGYNLTDDVIEVDCDPGFHWVELGVADSNGNLHYARAAIFARDPDSDESISAFQIDNHRITKEGQQISLRILEDIPETTYLDGALVMVWEGEPSGPGDRSQMVFCGFHHVDGATISAQRTGLLRDTMLECLDVAGKLDILPGFPVSVENKTTPANWLEMKTADMRKYLHYLLMWHSTALELADFTLDATANGYSFVILGSDGQSLWDQAARRAQSLVPNHHLTCNTLGQLFVKVDPILQDTGDRTATIQATLTEADWSDIRYTHQRPPRVHWLRGEAILASATTISALFTVGPGLTPGQGETESTKGEQLAKSQDDLNSQEGHRYARLNAEETFFNITLAEGDDQGIEPAALTWVRLNISTAVAAQRGLALPNVRGLVHEVNIRYQHERTGLVKTVTLLWERETSGTPAITYIPPTTPEVPWEPDPGGFEPPPTTGDGFSTAISWDGTEVRLTRDFGAASPDWVDITGLAAGAELYDLCLDPYSPATTGYLATDAGIYKSTNLDTASPTFTLILDADDVETELSAVADSFLKAHKIVGSPNNQGYFGFAFMIRRTDRELWFAYTTDSGANWNFSLIAANGNQTGFPLGFAGYVGGLDIVPRVIAGDLRLYVAFYNDVPDAKYRLYRSDDKGENWAEVAELTGGPDPNGGVCVHCPYNGNLSGNIVYWSYVADGDVQSAFYSTDGGSTANNLAFPADGSTDDELGTAVKRTGIESYTQDRLLMYAWQDATNDLLLSDDGGVNWTPVTMDTPFSGTPVASGGFPFASNGGPGELLYLMTTSGIYVSVDRGVNWQDKTGNWSGYSGTLYNSGIVPLWVSEA